MLICPEVSLHMVIVLRSPKKKQHGYLGREGKPIDILILGISGGATNHGR